MTGVIRRLLLDKGFGFLADEQTGVEHFFHRSGVQGTRFEHLKEGERVSYETEDHPKGPRAKAVTRL